MDKLVHSKVTRKKAAGKTAPAPSRTNDPARTMAEILQVATAEFAAKGLSGARIDAIAEATRTSKRMIYYYYGSKEGLCPPWQGKPALGKRLRASILNE